MTCLEINNKASVQRPDYTFKFNNGMGRHGWLRLTPAYSVKLVQEIMHSCDVGIKVLDPFSGTGTTALCATYAGNNAVAFDINPFLIWLGKTKIENYSPNIIKNSRIIAERILQDIFSNQCALSDCPPIHNIERWWHPDELRFLRLLKASIQRHLSSSSLERNLLLLGMCRLIISLSNAAFNHQSMSFNNHPSSLSGSLLPDHEISMCFWSEMNKIFDAAYQNPRGQALIIHGDARKLHMSTRKNFDLIITSPPYPNRMSYIRELRPYMYWLDYLTNAKDAGELDWQAIGGTWGIATSRLMHWKAQKDVFVPSILKDFLKKVSHPNNKNGLLMANYVAKYFEDMWIHIKHLPKILTQGAKIHYIVGNSTFYETLLPVEVIYKKFFQEAGFQNVKIKTLRKRSSKKELFEFDVHASL